MASALSRKLGKSIREARRRHGLTQAQLASRIAISRPSLSAYENGNTIIGVDVIADIARVLDEDFEVDGYAITRRTSFPRVLAEQLCFTFDTERTFTDATIRIKPSRGVLLITASVPTRRVRE